MTEGISQSRARRGRRRRHRILAAAIAGWIIGFGLTASAQAPDNPLPPPEKVPTSRLTVTPSEFQRWLSRRPGPAAAVKQPETPAPPIATPPPPPPSLAAPPAPPVLAPVPRASAPAAVPAAPELQAPPPPPTQKTATLPPESPSTTVPPELAARGVPRPDDIRIVYAPDATDIPARARNELDDLAEWLAANPSKRIQIEAYASQTTSAGSEARRLSLLRAREVRRYLITKGAADTQIDVRARGGRTEKTPKDRVEITLPSP